MKQSNLLLVFILLFQITKQEEYELSSNPIDNYIEYNSTVNNDNIKYGNVVEFYHMPWCKFCKKSLPLFKETSMYEIASDFLFISINCKENRNKCKNIRKYPTLKVIYQNKTIPYEVGGDPKNILNFIQKLKHFPIITQKEKNENYITIQVNANDNIVKNCFNANPYLNLFGPYELHEIINKTGKIFVKLNNESSLEMNLYKNTSCSQIEEFINKIKYYPLKKLDGNYMNIVSYHNKTNILFFITIKQFIQYKTYLNNLYSKYLNNSNIVFSYVLIDNQSGNDDTVTKMINYFKPEPKIFPNFLIFDHKNEKFSFISENNGNIEKYINNEIKIKYYTGDIIQDFFIRIGITNKITTQVFKKILLFLIIFLLFLLVILHFIFRDTNDTNENPLEKEKKE